MALTVEGSVRSGVGGLEGGDLLGVGGDDLVAGLAGSVLSGGGLTLGVSSDELGVGLVMCY